MSVIVTMTVSLTMSDGVYIKTRVAMMILMVLILIPMTSTLAMMVDSGNDLGGDGKDVAM